MQSNSYTQVSVTIVQLPQFRVEKYKQQLKYKKTQKKYKTQNNFKVSYSKRVNNQRKE